MRKSIAILAILFLLPINAFATGQQPDILIYKGKTYDLFANPLESFFKNEEDRPAFMVRPGTMSTGNWRGYVATWKVIDGFLYLVNLDSWICKDWDEKSCKKVNLKSFFGSRYRDGKVKADWFSGDLRMPDGKLIQYVHMGYGSVYEREITLEVKSGQIVGETVVDNTKKVLPSELELQRRELEKMKPKP